MDVVEIISLASSEAVEIKLEDIESESENCPEQNLNAFLKCKEVDRITSEGLIESHSKPNSNFLGDEDITDNSEDEQEFHYVCNVVNVGAETININEYAVENDSQSEPENGVQTGPISHPFDELIEEINNKNGQINGKAMQKTTILSSESQKDEENLTVNRNKYFSDELVHYSEIRVIDNGFECVYCKHSRLNMADIRDHIRCSHRDMPPKERKMAPKGKKRKQCPHCPKTTVDLGYHIYSIHTKPEDISWHYCGDCDYKTKHKQCFHDHIHAKHTDPSLYVLKECKECGRKFRKTGLLNRHIKTVHHPETMKRFKCNYCPYTTTKKNTLKCHQSTHVAPAEGFKCSKCDFIGKTFLDILHHRNSEHREWIQCHLCAYKCRCNNSLRLHLIHHQEKKTEKDLKYKCEKCDYKTYRVYNLRIHMLNHKKPKEIEMFQCYHCSFKAKRKDNLKTHIFKHDVYRNILDCFICSFKTRSKYQLTRHVDTHSKAQTKEAELLHLSTNGKHKIIIKTKKEKKNERTKRVRNNKNLNTSKNKIQENSKENQERINEDEKLLESCKTIKKLEVHKENDEVVEGNQTKVEESMKINESWTKNEKTVESCLKNNED